MTDKILHFVAGFIFQLILVFCLFIYSKLTGSLIEYSMILALLIGVIAWLFHEIGQQRARYPDNKWWTFWLWDRDSLLDMAYSISGHMLAIGVLLWLI